MWTWDQSAGTLKAANGKIIATGYSGKGSGKNNPTAQAIRAVGPVPCGLWKIGAPYNSKNVGPFALPLTAVDSKPTDDIHQPTGRSAFRIHGDSARNPGDASNGCIILPRIVREQIWRSGDHDLQVVE